MASGIEKLIEDIRSLPPTDKRRIRDVIDLELAEWSSSSEGGEEEFKRKLVEDGLLKAIKPRVTDFAPYRDRRPVEIEGKPLSQTIIEERR